MRMSSTWLLNDLQDRVLTMGGRQLSEYGILQPQAVDKYRLVLEYHREIDYDQNKQQAYVEWYVPLLTLNQ